MNFPNSIKMLLLLALTLSFGLSITFDFQCGCLQGWTITGDAFVNQPTLGDNPTARNRGMPSNHQGNYWIGTYQNYTSLAGTPGTIAGDGPTGTMTSEPFVIQKKFITFLISGGNLPTIHLDLIDSLTNTIIYTATGQNTQTLQYRNWNVEDHIGKSVYIRAVDQQTGGWGHLNFDDFKFVDSLFTIPFIPCFGRPCFIEKQRQRIVPPVPPCLSCPDLKNLKDLIIKDDLISKVNLRTIQQKNIARIAQLGKLGK